MNSHKGYNNTFHRNSQFDRFRAEAYIKGVPGTNMAAVLKVNHNKMAPSLTLNESISLMNENNRTTDCTRVCIL